MAQKLILDVDTGTDDAVAIMLAALHPAIDLVGITTVNGNIEVEKCTDNTLRVLEWIEKGDIPVFEGLAHPIVRDDFPVPRVLKRDPKVHMPVLPLPAPKGQKQGKAAPTYLCEAVAAQPGEIALVAVGPLSNVAAAIALDPDFVRNVKELVVMGGAIDKSNITPSAEFNIWADPEAASKVLGAKFHKVTLVPLDATHDALVSREQCAFMRSLDTPAGTASADIVEHRINGYEANQPTGVPESAPVHDAVCIAALIDSTVIETKFVNVVVETVGEHTIGRTVVDHQHRTTRPANCHVAFHADSTKFFHIVSETFSRK
jgi:inosine-uridine nucleoside N-ribohydrolase